MAKPPEKIKIDVYPYLLPIILAATFAYYSTDIYLFAAACGVSLQQIFSGIFNISSVLAGFLFSIYCYIAVSSNPFIERIQNTSTFRSVIAFVLRTTIVSSISAMFSLVMSSFKWEGVTISFYESVAITTWFFLFCLNIAYFAYCMHSFTLLSRDIPTPQVRGG